MTIPGFGRIMPIQGAPLRHAGYRLSRSAERNAEPISCDELRTLMATGLRMLRLRTGVDFGYDLAAWETYLIENSDEYRHRYGFATTREHVAVALSDDQRNQLVSEITANDDAAP